MLRGSAGLSQEAAAGRAEIDWRRWQRLEDGTVNATLRTLARVAEAVGLTFWELLQVSPTPPTAAPKRAKRQP